MNNLRAAAQQALEALEIHSAIKHPQQRHYRDAAIEALRAALAESVQEPVAWALHTGTRQGIKWNRRVEHGTPLYTNPREWQGLTDEELVGMTCECADDGTFNMDCVVDLARAIETKLREKNA